MSKFFDILPWALLSFVLGFFVATYAMYKAGRHYAHRDRSNERSCS